MLLSLSQHKVYVIGGNYAIERMFQQAGAELCNHLNSATIAVWTGGADVNPELYGEARHPRTYINKQRDLYEKACFEHTKDKLKIGICRGAQFLNVMNGGLLWQDIDKHGLRGTHEATYKSATGLLRAYNVTSTHHQQMIPKLRGDKQCEVWAWAGISSKKTCGIKDQHGEWCTFTYAPPHTTDTEILYYPSTRSLCFQPHPEYDSESTRDLFFKCIERALAA